MEDQIKRMVLAVKDNRKDLKKARNECNTFEESYCLGYDAELCFAFNQMGIEYKEVKRMLKEVSDNVDFVTV